MKKISYIVNKRHGKAQSVSCYIDGQPLNLRADHPNFPIVLEELEKAEPNKKRICSLMSKVAAIKNASDQTVTVHNGRCYYKGEEVGGALVDAILEFDAQGLPYKPLKRFLENLLQNPSERARKEAWPFLSSQKFTFTPDGCFLAYKGVQSNWYSKTAGSLKPTTGKVDTAGRVFNGKGEVIEVKREDVDPDQHQTCSYGLHVGAFAYANDFASDGALVLVKVNPRDIVSVPTDCGSQKCRVCRYEVVDVLESRQSLSQRLEAKYLAADDEDAPTYHNVRGANGRFAKA